VTGCGLSSATTPDQSLEEAARVPPPELPATRPHSKDRDPGGGFGAAALVHSTAATALTGGQDDAYGIHVATSLVSRMGGPRESTGRHWRVRRPHLRSPLASSQDRPLGATLTLRLPPGAMGPLLFRPVAAPRVPTARGWAPNVTYDYQPSCQFSAPVLLSVAVSMGPANLESGVEDARLAETRTVPMCDEPLPPSLGGPAPGPRGHRSSRERDRSQSLQRSDTAGPAVCGPGWP
jgi:hypothetical protein